MFLSAPRSQQTAAAIHLGNDSGRSDQLERRREVSASPSCRQGAVEAHTSGVTLTSLTAQIEGRTAHPFQTVPSFKKPLSAVTLLLNGPDREHTQRSVRSGPCAE